MPALNKGSACYPSSVGELHKGCKGHLLQVYKKPQLLATSVAEYIRLGLANGESAVILATRQHWDLISDALQLSPSQFEEMTREGRLQFMAVSDVLKKIAPDGLLNYSLFENLLLSIPSPSASIRYYGEVVDVLASQGQMNSALELESYWNRFLSERPGSSLLCGYAQDRFESDEAKQNLSLVQHVHEKEISFESLSEDELYLRIAILEHKALAFQNESSERSKTVAALEATKQQLAHAGKMSILGELCAGLAHELNNPLTIIQGNLHQTRRFLDKQEAAQPLRGELGTRLDRMENATQRMTKIIKNILTFGRQKSAQNDRFAITTALQRSVDIMQEQLKDVKVSIRSELPLERSLTRGDEDLMVQVFLNLLSNARDAIEAAKPGTDGSIAICLAESQKGEIEISLEDNGIGMSEETRAKVFFPFFTTKGVGKGTGLGLSLAHGIVAEHQGTITCDSKLGQGTRFCIRLPKLAA